jgi:hypothetical protein
MTACLGGLTCGVLVAARKTFPGVLLFKLGVGVLVNFDHNQIRRAVVAFLPIMAVGNAAFDFGHGYHLRFKLSPVARGLSLLAFANASNRPPRHFPMIFWQKDFRTQTLALNAFLPTKKPPFQAVGLPADFPGSAQT